MTTTNQANESTLMLWTKKDLLELASKGRQLEKKISMSSYLLFNNYQQVSPRCFVKDNSPEIIRVTHCAGRDHFINFFNKEDSGTLTDFVRNRSIQDGHVIPNQKIFSFQLAVGKLQAYFNDHMQAVRTRKKFFFFQKPGTGIKR
jgi:hypothetical protein